MGNTSNHACEEDFATQLVNPFFNRAQLTAFSVPPRQSAIETINKGGQQDYIPHEYIRTLLDRFIGTGRWELQATLHSTDKEIVQKWDNRERKKVDRVAATANVNVSLIVHAQDGSDKTLVYSAVGSNTQYAGVDQGYGAIIGNAISSAESLGLKRAATNLGKAFGFDLKSKVKKDDLPPNLHHYVALVNERFAARHGTAQISDQRSEHQTSGQIINQPAQTTDSTDQSVSSDTADPAPTPANNDPAPQRNERPTPQTPPAARDVQPETPAADRSEPTTTAPQPEARTDSEARAPANDASEPSANAGSANQSSQPSPDADWELSLVPGKYEEWIKCIKTMARRVNAMTNEREIQNFTRRNQKLIAKLPVLAATDGQPERNFKKRWSTILAKRYNELGLDIPEELQQALPQAA